MEQTQLSPLPTQVQGYQLGEIINETAFTTTYLASDEASSEKVMLILYRLEATESNIEQAKKLASLPLESILPVFDAGNADGFLYVSCQHLESAEAGSLASKSASISNDFAQETIGKIAQALSLLHKEGLVHGNLNPQSIHFDQSGQVYFSHFTFDAPHKLLAVGSQTDDASYTAPEIIQHEPASIQSDLFSLGVLAYFCATGKAFHEGSDAYQTALLQLAEPLPALTGLPNNLESFIAQACRKNIHTRLSSIDASGLKLSGNATANTATQAESSLGSINTSEISNNSSDSDTSEFSLSADLDDRRPKKSKAAKPSKSGSNNGSKTPLIAGIAVLVLLIVFPVAVYLSPAIPALSALQPLHAKVMEMLDPSLAEIKTLLAQGQEQIDQEAYLDAAQTYHKVLGIKSDQAEAKAKIDWLVDHYLSQAYSTIEAQDFMMAEIHINHALDIDSKHPTIPPAQALYQERLNEKLANEQAAETEEANRLEQERLAAEEQARLAEEAARLAQEQADAETARLAAEEADRQRKAAEAEAARKAAAEAEAARLAAEEQARKEAEAARLAEEAAEKKRREAEALAKAAEIQADLDRRNALLAKVKVTGLLKKAETYYTRGEYRSPAKENALEYYQEVLKLDPSNAQAQTGLDKTVSAIMPELATMFNNEQFSQGKLLYDQLRAAAPNHEELELFGAAQGL